MKITQMKNSTKKGIRSKLLNIIRRVGCGVNKFVSKSSTVAPTSQSDAFNAEKWHKRIQKTCHDFDAMETTVNRSSHNATLECLHSKRDVYRSELKAMQSEIQNLRREKEMVQRGLQTRQSRRLKRAQDSRPIRNYQRTLPYRSDSAYTTSTPRNSTYQSNDENVFYVFL